MIQQQENAIAETTKRPRELGVEILRISAILLIVCQHFMNHGGFLKNAGENEFFLNLLHVLFAPAVNVFILISGYFSINTRRLNLKKGAELWLQVLFYSLTMLLISAMLGASFSNLYVYTSFTPITYKHYWFFSAYFILYLVTPFLSAMLNAITKKQHLALVIGIFVCAYLSTRFDISKVLSLASGYSILWFIMLFCVGAYFRKYPIGINKPAILVIYVLTVAIQTFFRYYLNDTSLLINKLVYASTDYNQPITLLASICLLLLFLGIKSNGGRLHRFLIYMGSCTFGVYLFHEFPKFRQILYGTIFKTERFWGHPQAVLIVILFALLTFGMGCIMETVRKLIFGIVKKAIAAIKRESIS